MKTILTFAAHPDSVDSLQLNREIRDIEALITDQATYRNDFKFVRKDAVRWSDFQRHVLKYKPRIVHFSGHGSGTDGLVLEDEQSQPAIVSTDVLSSLFEQVSEYVECVLLNACYSFEQAQAISQHVNYVIGMGKAIPDQAAIAYSKGFYLALGEGEPVENAHTTGCREILQQANDAGRSRDIAPLTDDRSAKTALPGDPEIFIKHPLTKLKELLPESADVVLIASSIVKLLSPHLHHLILPENPQNGVPDLAAEQGDTDRKQAGALWKRINSHFSTDPEVMGAAAMISGNSQNSMYQQMLGQILSEKLKSNQELAQELFELIDRGSGIQRVAAGNEALIEGIKQKMADAGTQEIQAGDRAVIRNIDMEMS